MSSSIISLSTSKSVLHPHLQVLKNLKSGFNFRCCRCFKITYSNASLIKIRTVKAYKKKTNSDESMQHLQF